MATTLPSPDARHSSTEDVEIAMNDEKHEAMHMEKVESGRNPQVVYEIDEVHQKKVMYAPPNPSQTHQFTFTSFKPKLKHK